MRKENWNTHISVVAVFLSIGLLSFFFVPTHDDLIDLSCYGLGEALQKALLSGNGRFLGNTFVRMFLNSTIADSVIRTVCIGGIVVSSAVLINGYKVRAILVSFLMFLGIGLPIFRQVFVWGHGFYNYVPPVFLLIVVLCVLKFYYQTDDQKHEWIVIPCVFFTTFFSQFFAENSTTINFLVMGLVLAWVCLKKKKKQVAISATLGAGLGAIGMFLGPSLMGTADRLDEYRSTGISIINAVKNLFEIVNTLSTGWGLWLAASVLVILLAKSRGKYIPWAFKVIIAIFPAVSALQSFTTRAFVKIGLDLCFFIYLICVSVALLKIFDKKETKCFILIVCLAVLSIAQLLVVSPIGPRCLLITYTLLVLGVLFIFSILDEDKVRYIRCVSKWFAGLCGVLYLLLLVIYVQSGKIHNVRMEYAWEQLAEGKMQIEIIELPHEPFFHCSNDSYVYSYVFNHGDKDAMSFVYISYSGYCEKFK